MRYDWMDAYLMEKPGVTKDFKPEWNWTLYRVGGRIFCALCHNDAGGDELITMKLEPMRGEFLRSQFDSVIPGYYMNKVHWNSVKTEGELPEEILRDMLEEAYRLVAAGLTKKLRAQLGIS